jgi:hypothetical protein
MDGDSIEIMENINDSIGKCWYFRDPIEKTPTLLTNWKSVDAEINWLSFTYNSSRRNELFWIIIVK